MIQSIKTTLNNLHDILPSGNLRHDNEHHVFNDADHGIIQKRDEHRARKKKLL
jgi:hypothetical protein